MGWKVGRSALTLKGQQKPGEPAEATLLPNRQVFILG